MGAEDEVRMDLDAVSLAAGSGGEDSGTGISNGTIINSNSSSNINTSTSTSNNNTNINNPNHSSSSRRNSSKFHPLLRHHQLKFFNHHLPRHRVLRPMSVNIFPQRFNNSICRMGLTLIKDPFRSHILHLLMQA
jgi:hypothetical protein